MTSTLVILSKYERYMEYMFLVISKLPRVEKFNLGQEYKSNMYKTLESIILLNKLGGSKLELLNRLDADIVFQRLLTRLMYKGRYIDEKKYMYIIDSLEEIGKMLGGYIKSEKKG